MATVRVAWGVPTARAHPVCFASSRGVRAVGERAWSARAPRVSGASGASGVSSRRPKRGGASPAAASPRWWDVKARLETALRRDERSEFGYLEHDSEGETVFRERSSLNGDVHVVKHGPWRSLRFNEVEQGLSYVRETRDEATGEVLRVTADADVLGYEYLRCMTAAAAAMCRLDVGADWTKVDGVEEKKNASRVVCVGLGSGAMPAFIANAFPELLVEVVEIDDVVVDAAEKALGLPGIRTRRAEEPEETTDKKAGVEPEPEPQSGRQKSLGNLRVVIGDASAFMASAAAAVRRGEASAARAIFLDAFDGEGETPPRLTSSAFLRDCAACVAPGGVVVANCFNGVRGSKARHGAESFAVALSREIGPVTSWTVETPVNVVFAARSVFGASSRDDDETEKTTRMTKASSSKNVNRFSRAELRDAARALGAERGFEWDAGERVRRAFWVEVVEEKDAEAFPRLIREQPAGIDVNPLSALAARMGTTMPREWEEDEETK